MVRREYEEDAVETAMAPRALAAWPDFRLPPGADDAAGKAPWWHWNYLFTSTNVDRTPTERSVLVTSGISREILERDLAIDKTDPATVVERYRRRLEAWGSERGPWSERSGKRTDRERTWFQWLRMPDEAGPDRVEKSLQRSDFTFDAALFRLPSAHGDEYAGLGILPHADETRTQAPAAGGVAEIAVDFGTSNSIVYVKRGKDGEIEPLRFTPRLRKFNKYPDPDAGGAGDEEAEYTAFMPSTEVTPPFPTVVQARSAGSVADLRRAWVDAGEPELWLDLGFFDPKVRHLTESLLSGTSGTSGIRWPDLFFDVKWGTDSEARARMGRYLRHIVMLCLAEVVGDRDRSAPTAVTWRFSYPMAMPHPDEYREKIKSAAHSGHESWSAIEFHTESDAALGYFENVEETTPQAMLVLDIGGGSTDIALDARQSRVWQYSVRLAGDELVPKFVSHNRRILDELDLTGDDGVFGDGEDTNRFMNSGNENVARAIVNGPQFGAALHRRWVDIKDGGDIERLRVGAAVMLGGLCSFLGLQIRSLLDDKDTGFGPDNATSIRLCFGGRGSTLFKLWERDEAFQELWGLVGGCATADAAPNGRPHVTASFSKYMKHEVAQGMLMLGGRTGETPFPANDLRVVVGVGASLDPDGTEVAAGDFMDKLRGKGSDRVRPALDWDEFQGFCDRTGAVCGFRLTPEPDAQDDIMDKGRQAFRNLVRDEEDLEPPFIAMLRKTLRLILEGKKVKVEWDEPRHR